MYTCPMHPEVQQDKPGMCPECGMNLVKSGKRKAQSHDKPFGVAQDKHAGHSTAMFFRKFWVSLALTIPVVLYADVIEKILKLIGLYALCKLHSLVKSGTCKNIQAYSCSPNISLNVLNNFLVLRIHGFF